MAFSYTINAGKLIYGTDASNKTYLQSTFGFSNEALSGMVSTSTLANAGKFALEYSAIFNSTLAVSDGYKFFEEENTNHMESLLTTNEIGYTSKKAVSRIDAYTEMFMENFKGSANSNSIAITKGAFDFDGFKFNHYDSTGKIVLSTTTLNASNVITNLNQIQLKDLADQLEKEALLLKSELQTNELAYGGYPAIGYTAADAKVKLLKQQMDSAMQDFITVYDNLFAQYKIDAGAHKFDNGSGTDVVTREEEAGTAATMAAMMAINYAESYYNQDIKPNVADYVFGQAPIMFSYIDNTTSVRTGYNQTSQSSELTNTLAQYTTGYVSNLDKLFLEDNSSSAYAVKNTTLNSTIDSGHYERIFWDMNKGIDSSNNQTTGMISGDIAAEGGGFVNGVATTDVILDDMCGTQSAISRYINWIVRDSFAVGGQTTTIRNTDYCSETADYNATEIFNAAQKLVSLKMQLEEASIEAAINNQVLAEYEARVGALTALKSLNYCLGTDPYTVNIDGKEYMMGQDSNADGNISDMQEILGINDTQSNIFQSLKKLDTNNDGYVSQEELQAQNIVLKAIENGQLSSNGYDMSLVKGINLASLQNTDGTNNVFGNFTMDLQDKQVNGKLTFEDGSYFTNLFGKNISEEDIADDSSVAPIAIPTSNTTTKASTVTTVENIATTDLAPATEEVKPSTSSIDTSDFSFNFNDADDNKSTIEKLFEQICWKLGISNISSSQKYSIIDGIDPNTDTNIAEAAIQEDLEKFNLSA